MLVASQNCTTVGWRDECRLQMRLPHWLLLAAHFISPPVQKYHENQRNRTIELMLVIYQLRESIQFFQIKSLKTFLSETERFNYASIGAVKSTLLDGSLTPYKCRCSLYPCYKNVVNFSWKEAADYVANFSTVLNLIWLHAKSLLGKLLGSPTRAPCQI